MKLPRIEDLTIAGKRVLLRTNYDVPLKIKESKSKRVKEREWIVADETRIEETLPTIKYLLRKKARIIIISHLGRPEGKEVTSLSLKPVAQKLKELLNSKLKVKNEKLQFKIKKFSAFKISRDVVLLENLRFYPGEEENNLNFAKSLVSLADFYFQDEVEKTNWPSPKCEDVLTFGKTVYVNDAFACSHRNHASIVSIPRFLPSAFGFDFLEEIKVLSRIRERPKRPIVLLLGGVKKDKIEAVERLVSWVDYILIGGKLVEYNEIPNLVEHPKIVGHLVKSGQDITNHTIGEFKKIIFKAKTIIWAGPMGNFYNKRYLAGTRVIAEAVVKSGAFTVVGGGDTEVALTQFGLEKEIDFISSGGGAMLEFLAEGTLPGIQAVLRELS